MKLASLSMTGLLALASCRASDRSAEPLATSEPSPLVLRMNVDDDLAFLEIHMSPAQGDHDDPCVEIALKNVCGPNYQVDRQHDVCRARIVDSRAIDFAALELGFIGCGRTLTSVRMRVRSRVDEQGIVVARTRQVFRALDHPKPESLEAVRAYEVVPSPDWKHVGLRSAK